MQLPPPDAPDGSPPGRDGAGCSGCSKCDESPHAEASKPALGGFRGVLIPIGLFLFPVVLAVVGAVLGRKTASGELLGGLLGLATGMAASVFVARAIGLTDPHDNRNG